MKTLSVIIAHINNHKELYYTLWDLFKELNGFDYEIIVVDNGSEKGNFESIRQYIKKMAVYHNVKLFKYDKFQGTVPPWQYGISKAVGEYLIIIDSHITVCKDYFKKQIEVLNNDKDIKVLYSASCFTNYGIDKGYNYWFNKENFSGGFLAPKDINKDNLFQPLISQMGCVIVDRHFFKDINMFGNCFLKYGGYGAEEFILAIKTKMFGGKTVFNKEVFFHHSILHKSWGKKLKLHNKAIAAYILDGKDYMLEVIKNQPKDVLDELSEEERGELIKEIPKLAKEDRKFMLTAPISYNEITNLFV